MIAPLILGLAVFQFGPALRTVYISFTTEGVFGGSSWVGLSNYAHLLGDTEFWLAMRNSFGYTLMLVLGVPLALILAALINQKGLRFSATFRVLFFIPVITMPTAVALVWRLILNGEYGPLNAALAKVGIPPQYWIDNPRWALLALGVVGIWSSLGFNIIILQAGLSALPRDLYEAAEIDGASRRVQFTRVTIPLLSPAIFLVVIISIIWGMQMFDLVYVMLGPVNPAIESAETVGYLFYQRAFVQNEQGSAAAISLLLLLVTLAITLVQFRMQKRWVHAG
jgi:multiple sugar transport system permease protein